MIARDALAALDASGVRWCIRNAPHRVDDLPPGSDIDVIVDDHDLAGVDTSLVRSGFHAFAARGHAGHRFYLAFDGGRWWKLDVMFDAKVLANRERAGDLWVASAADQREHETGRKRGRPNISRRARIGRAWPLSWKRYGPVVAVLGPDGAGKGTVIAALERAIPVGVTVVRLGTARSGAPIPLATPAPRVPVWRELAFVIRKWLVAWRRLFPAYAAAWRGHVVLCDRHPLEVRAVRPERGAVAGALERVLLSRLLPRPDAVVVLDAPAAVLVGRKPEHPAATIEQWRAGYRSIPGAVVVPTDGSIAAASESASSAVWNALAARRAWR